MRSRSPIKNLLPLLALIIFVFSACQPQVTQQPPTPTVIPTATITPTAQPLQITIGKLIDDCEQLAAEKQIVILEGAIMLPDESVTGYEIDGVRWLGMDLIKTSKVKVLVRVGTEAGTMNDLPSLFSEKDLVIRAADGGIILDRHRVRITGRPKYKANDPDRRCELFVDEIDTLEKPEVLIPKEMTIQELLNNDRINDCKDVEAANQLVRMRGWITVNDNDTVCTYGSCRTPFSDGSGRMMVKLANGGGSNSIGMLTAPYLLENVRLLDQNGEEAKPSDVTFIGQITGISEYCLLTVYTILPVGSD